MSKLQESLMRTIEGGKKDDPFSSVDSAASDLRGSADNPSSLDDAVEEVPVLKIKRKPSRQTVILVFSITLSFVSLLMTSYVYLTVGEYIATQEESLAGVNAAIGEQNKLYSDHVASYAKAEKSVDMRIEDLNGELMRVDKDLSGKIESVVARQKNLRNQHDESVLVVQQNTKAISELDGRLTKITSTISRPNKQARKVNVEKKEKVSRAFDGVYLASIDVWGATPYIMLKERTDGWIPLTEGDVYKGWRLVSIGTSEVSFKKGNNVQKLKVTE